MANATNGPNDPDAGTGRRGRAERSRAEADPTAPPATPAATPARRTRPVAATAKPTADRPARTRRTPQPATPEPAEAEAPDPAEPPAMTRGIVELAAERLAASRAARDPEPEPATPAADDPMTEPGVHPNSRAAGTRRSSRSTGPGIRAVPGGTRPGTGNRPPPASRPPTGPPEAVRPQPGLSEEDGRLETPGPPARPEPPDESAPIERPGAHRAETLPGLPGTGLEPYAGLAGVEPHAESNLRYPRTRNRPGLPPSVRLPAELPDNLWPPPALMDPNLAGNLHVPVLVPPRAEEPSPDERRRPTAEALRDEEREPGFLPSVLARGGDDTGYVPVHSRDDDAPAPHTAPLRRILRRRRAVLVAYLLIVVMVLIAGHQLRDREQPLVPGREAAQRAAEPAGIGPAAGPVPPETRAEPVEPAAPASGEAKQAIGEDDEPKAKAGDFRYARGRGPMLGTAGELYRFRVAVEKIVGDTSAREFAEAVDGTLSDDRSWVNDGRLRLRRVANGGDDVDFTIFLASAPTSEEMCAAGGLATEGYTSCRIPGQVIINADRWADATPDYEGRLKQYREYTINHEVGHELGHGHEKCPGEGEKAPVMMQQTFGLKGCTPNPWPYLDGERYAGEPVA
ncbi:hypothetical protein Aca07nite_74250 [Actinoplanes capillaceus]|uniref:DUF3152 domain-containing protein n=2 Tax=Actinoplanes campanulatus TaxID=113559 RepID=A0ABQ3WV69_9ACTN|nr:hypothetical protein Aca07nite_74250 [Actinoplanes capillaceus]